MEEVKKIMELFDGVVAFNFQCEEIWWNNKCMENGMKQDTNMWRTGNILEDSGLVVSCFLKNNVSS